MKRRVERVEEGNEMRWISPESVRNRVIPPPMHRQLPDGTNSGIGQDLAAEHGLIKQWRLDRDGH
jgi:hypothetical protein